MQYDEFVGQVQHRARLASTGEAVHAIHATLSTLSERIFGNEATNLAAQLPQEIGVYLIPSELPEVFSMKNFYERVASRERADLPIAIYHARAVMSVVLDAVSPGEIADLRAQLPREYDHLFTYEGEGGMHKTA